MTPRAESTAASSHSLRAEIVEIGRRLHDRGLITATEGNISVRCPGGQLVTAGGVRKGSLTPDHVVRTDLDGRRIEGVHPVSSESAMHLAIYRRRPDVNAVVHAHPPFATAFAVAPATMSISPRHFCATSTTSSRS